MPHHHLPKCLSWLWQGKGVSEDSKHTHSPLVLCNHKELRTAIGSLGNAYSDFAIQFKGQLDT